jgi:hypothetical protein
VVVWRELVRESSADRTAKAVGWGLSTFMDVDGCCRLGRARLAEACSMSVRATEQAVARLELLGLLAVSRTLGGNPVARVNGYRALLSSEARSPLSSEGAAPLSGEARSPANGVPSAANGTTLSGEARSPVLELEEQDARAGAREPDDEPSSPAALARRRAEAEAMRAEARALGLMRPGKAVPS